MAHLTPLHRFRFLCGGIFLAAACSVSGAEALADPIIELPKMVVTDSRDLPPPEAWRYAEIPGFEILTNASDKATQRLIRDFQSFNFAADVVWPGLQPKTALPISLIICGSGGKFDAFVPGKKSDAESGLASLFLQDREQGAIVIDFQTKAIDLASIARNAAGTGTPALAEDADATAAASSSSELQVDHYRQLYREYLRYLMSRVQPRFPAWFEEGLAQLFMGMTWDRRTITFARLQDPNLQSAIGGAEDTDFNQALIGRAIMPLPELFSVERDSPTAINPLGSIWAKQCQAFVHLCLYGDGQRFQKGLIAFLIRLQKEPVSEALFQECFNKTYKAMLSEIRMHQEFTVSKSFEWTLPKGQTIPLPPLIALRDATPGEIGRIKGDALRLAGHSQAAHTALIAPYIRGERDPGLLASLGLEEQVAGRDDRAEKFLNAAIEAKTLRPRAYLELARIRYKAGLASPAAADGGLSRAQVAHVLAPLLTARNLPPALPEIYDLIGETLARGADVPRKEDVAVLYDGVNQFRGRLSLVYQTAALSLRAGEIKGATTLVDYGIRVAPNDTSRARFLLLKESLPPLPAAPATTPAKP